MATAEQDKLSVIQPDSSDYVAKFRREALLLIIAGHKKLTENAIDYSNKEEPSITGEIIRSAQLYSEKQDSPEWAYPYSIHDDPPENDGNREGKGRKRVDVIIERTQRGKHPRIRFEAKRLKMPVFSAGKYVGKTGLGEFVAGNYAKNDDVAGMLGYIQSDDCDYWAEQIPNALNKKKEEVHLIKDGQWQEASLENVNDCYKTRHNRPTGERELLVYHLLLDFVR